MRTRFIAFVLACASALSLNPAHAELPSNFSSQVLDKLLLSPVLANPAMILIDGSTGEVVYEKNSNSPRKPASVMKVFSGASALEYLDTSASFNTSVFLGNTPKTLVIQGSLDPWFSTDNDVAVKMHRTSIPRIGFTTMKALKGANSGSLRNITIFYSGLYSNDVATLKAFWAKRGFKPLMKSVSPDVAQTHTDVKILDSDSPTILEILNFALLNSDNLLAERLARLASRAAGNAFNDAGVAITFAGLLQKFNIDPTALVVADGSGLSKENRITASLMGQLLLNLRKDEKFSALYTALPVSGVSGTLKERFTTTAPDAVGLVHAKTGTLNGTVTLAGYVLSPDREYVFVTLADEIPKGTKASDRARVAIDKLLGRIAAPNIPAQISNVATLP
jgi:D-alanyl-D-alanine carboxypeptidase